MLCGWPLIWKSQLQTHLSQSTLEAEYAALSSSLRTFLPLQRSIQEMVEKTRSNPLRQMSVHSTVFEDNQSTYFLARNQRLTNRTKYLLAKWHWFWELVDNKAFDIIKCPTDKMLAGYLTKQLVLPLYQNNRQGTQGW